MASAPEPPSPDLASAANPPDAHEEGPLLFGRYRVERELGRGGMGRVVLAFDTKLRIHVAVKLVPEQFMADAEAAEDLRREVLRGIALMHPAVVRTHTFEQDATGGAIVMEYIDGLTLTDWKERQPDRCFDCAELLPWLAPLCDVLDYAHREARIVHRDLKPRNIMISQEGRLKVADFGISATLTDSNSRVSSSGPTSGTPAYMSPQQVRGKRPSHLDDVYSLGATIYDLLAGKPPFFRGSAETVYQQVLSEPPTTMAERRAELGLEERPPIPPVWEQTIAACLAKDPAERPQSCGEVLARLQGLAPAAPLLDQSYTLTPEPVTSVPAEAVVLVPVPQAVAMRVPRAIVPRTVSRVRARHGRWLVLAVGALALGLGAWWFAGRKNRALPAANNTPLKAASVATDPAATKDAPFVNSLGMKFVSVPGTDVLFCIHETRRQDYAAFATEVSGVDGGWKQASCLGIPIGHQADHPVVMVNWADAQAFCAWLSKREGLTYRLPDDREWSVAVGLGLKEKTRRKFHARNAQRDRRKRIPVGIAVATAGARRQLRRHGPG